MRSRLVLVLIALSLGAPARAQERETDVPRRLIVRVLTRSDQGKVYCAIWRGPRGFPTERQRAVTHTLDRTIVSRRAQCVFLNLPPGEYAVAAFHDENGNDDLDQGAFGIPTEGTGASNDARGFMGPPPYDRARFQLPDAPVHRLTIRMFY